MFLPFSRPFFFVFLARFPGHIFRDKVNMPHFDLVTRIISCKVRPEKKKKKKKDPTQPKIDKNKVPCKILSGRFSRHVSMILRFALRLTISVLLRVPS